MQLASVYRRQGHVGIMAKRSVTARQTAAPLAPTHALPYLGGVDGLRALAVLAVLLYHADLHWARGGFLGVEVFFVISGYLITTLLLGEWGRTGAISLRAFWARRARRLLPAAYLLLVAVLTYAVLLLPAEVARLRGDALAAFAYLTNWYLIFAQRSYFEVSGRPSLLQHLWSLAVEEQFYLAWPIMLGFGLRRWPQRWLLWATLVGALAATALMAALYRPGVDPSRVYYGTDTRAAGFLVGATLALGWRPGHLPVLDQLELRLLNLLGGVGLVSLAWLVAQTNSFEPTLYRGGFAWVALLTAAVIAALAHPQARGLSRVLGAPPLRWAGLRSYGIYLWHWPIYMLTRPQLDLALSGLPLLMLRLGLTAILAELSFRFVEQPVRRGALARLWQQARTASGAQRWELLVRWAGGGMTALAFVVVMSTLIARAHPPALPPYLAVSAVNISSGTPMPSPQRSAAAVVTIAPTAAPPMAPTPTAASTVTPTLEATIEPPPATSVPTVVPAKQVFAIGDSVMLGAAGDMVASYDMIEVDAAVSRQASVGIDILRWRRDQGTLGDVVVVQLGNNGTFEAQQFDDMMGVLSGVPRVLVLTVKVPRPWEGPNNQVISAGVPRYPNAVLVDWYANSVDSPGYFWDDGIHLRPAGAAAYTSLILSQIAP